MKEEEDIVEYEQRLRKCWRTHMPGVDSYDCSMGEILFAQTMLEGLPETINKQVCTTTVGWAEKTTKELIPNVQHTIEIDQEKKRKKKENKESLEMADLQPLKGRLYGGHCCVHLFEACFTESQTEYE